MLDGFQGHPRECGEQEQARVVLNAKGGTISPGQIMPVSQVLA
jgi:hypothetical protein